MKMFNRKSCESKKRDEDYRKTILGAFNMIGDRIKALEDKHYSDYVQLTNRFGNRLRTIEDLLNSKRSKAMSVYNMKSRFDTIDKRLKAIEKRLK